MSSSDLKKENKGGRPTVMTPETLNRLKDAFLIGASDEEACAYAEIGASTLYDYQNDHPEFSEQKEAWKERPILKAKKSLFEGLTDPDLALRYLELKKRDEFYKKKNTDLTSQGKILKGLVQVETADENKTVPVADNSTT